MHILYTNNTLEKPAGTEVSTRDAALEMVERGHRVSAFSCQLGDIARQLTEAGVFVTADVRELPESPDVIHGHHHWETSVAALRWPGTPLLSFCRGDGWQENPCEAPWVFRYVGVDRLCAARLDQEFGFPRDRILTIPNGVDLDRFAPRPPLPEKPQRALVFSNYATSDSDNYLALVNEACAERGIACDALGAGVGRPVESPETVLGEYDIVFAKGKGALEAAATGCAVVVCDTGGIGPMATGKNIADLREDSFYWDSIEEKVTHDAVARRLAVWDPEATNAATGWIRGHCGLPQTMDRLESLYREAVASDPGFPSAETVSKFASDFLADAGLPYKLGIEVRALSSGVNKIKYAQERIEDPDDPYVRAKAWNRALNRCRKGMAALWKKKG